MLAKLRPWYRSTFGHAVVGGAVLWASLPPLDAYYLWLLAWFAPVWWVLLVRRRELGGRWPYAWLYLAGFLFWLAALHWLSIPNVYTAVGWVALSFYLGFYLPVFVGLSRVAVHRLRVPVILAAPVVWTGLELVRGHLLSGFTMASLGHTQYRWIDLIQMSDLAGGVWRWLRGDARGGVSGADAAVGPGIVGVLAAHAAGSGARHRAALRASAGFS